jgi:hypothetical protein
MCNLEIFHMVQYLVGYDYSLKKSSRRSGWNIYYDHAACQQSIYQAVVFLSLLQPEQLQYSLTYAMNLGSRLIQLMKFLSVHLHMNFFYGVKLFAIVKGSTYCLWPADQVVFFPSRNIYSAGWNKPQA